MCMQGHSKEQEWLLLLLKWCINSINTNLKVESSPFYCSWKTKLFQFFSPKHPHTRLYKRVTKDKEWEVGKGQDFVEDEVWRQGTNSTLLVKKIEWKETIEERLHQHNYHLHGRGHDYQGKPWPCYTSRPMTYMFVTG